MVSEVWSAQTEREENEPDFSAPKEWSVQYVKDWVYWTDPAVAMKDPAMSWPEASDGN